MPEKWQLKPRKSASKQLSVVKKLLRASGQIIHAGDPDREGQLLVDEVIDYCKVKKNLKDTAQRLLISDLNLLLRTTFSFWLLAIRGFELFLVLLFFELYCDASFKR